MSRQTMGSLDERDIQNTRNVICVSLSQCPGPVLAHSRFVKGLKVKMMSSWVRKGREEENLERRKK